MHDDKRLGTTQGAWRSEVHARVRGYRARRRWRENGTMPLDFDSAAAPTLESEMPPAPEPRREICDTSFYRRLNQENLTQSAGFPQRERELEVAPAMELPAPDPLPPLPQPAPVVQAVPERRNVITFPRPAVEPPLAARPNPDELAYAVTPPRILDVPEDNAPAIQQSLFPVRMEPEVEVQLPPLPQPRIEVPLQVAPIPLRVAAEAADALLVLSASLIFYAMTWHTYGTVHHGKTFWGLLALVPVLFGAVYEYLFLVHSGRTPGMQMMGMHLNCFDRHGTGQRERRRRAIYKIISAISLGLGFLWAFLDEDLLCWHDRITRTFLVQDS